MNVRILLLGALALSACGESDGKQSMADSDGGGEVLGDKSSAPLTYWQDMLPIFEAHCLQCHQTGGIASFRLDDYAEAKSRALLIGHSTATRRMPPWDATSDGSCGDLQQSLALTPEQIQRITSWVEGGAQEGTPVAPRVPPVEALVDPKEYRTPEFLPQIQGGPVAESDEYRCFMLDSNVDAKSFITGYEVVPGKPEIVHHVSVSLVDPDALAEPPAAPGLTNRQMMEQLDASSPDRLGWSCFGLAGEGVSVVAVPAVWAPGQGVVMVPGNSGIPIDPKYKVVVQVHYNLANEAHRGQAESTTVRLQLAPTVENVGVFAFVDPLMQSLRTSNWETLQPGLPSVTYTWKKTLTELDLHTFAGLTLWGVAPHMHERGRKFQMRVRAGEGAPAQCGVDVQRWNFHWQRLYAYRDAWPVGPSTEFEVTCDYDTTDASMPVLPGWGTNNEMCLAALYFTMPASSYGL